MNGMNPKVDFYFSEAEKWRDELAKLRTIVLDSPLTEEFSIPDEFLSKLEDNPDLETAFYALTPGRQRAYLLYFSAPKQSKTREARVEKFLLQILSGKGLNDR